MKFSNLLPMAITAALGLSGCVQSDFFVRNGVTYDRYERDGVQCQTTASQAVPTNTQVGWAPYVGIYSADTNAALRSKNVEFCMRDKGYSKVPIPYCSGAALTAATEAAKRPQDRNRIMRIASNSCWTADAMGAPFLFTPPGA